MPVLRAAWDDIVTAAHAVEAAFVAIGAAIDDALAWLKWAFDFKDVVRHRQGHAERVQRDRQRWSAPSSTYYEGKAHGWFVSQEATCKKSSPT